MKLQDDTMTNIEHVPSEITGTANMLGILTGMRGYEYWEVGPCADRRLVALLQRQLDDAHREIVDLKSQLGV